jgi:hypothetical protein
VSFGDNWATFDEIYGGEPSSDSWYDGALASVSDFASGVIGTADSWLDNLMQFELAKDQLGYQNQLQQQANLLGTVESDQQTGNVPSSPNYQQVPVTTGGVSNNKLLLIGAALVAAYLLVK